MTPALPDESARSPDRALALEVDGVGVSFGRAEVLKSAGLGVGAGEIVALLGRNGAGKSTLFRVVAGFVRADWGFVRFAGRTWERPRLARLARDGLLYSAQESSLSPILGVREHFVAYARRWGGADRIDRIVEALRLGPWLQERVGSLSGGERQRLSIALALLRRPRCLLADEPFAGVAPRDRGDISRALRELADRGCAVAISGHDVEDIFDVAERVVWMTAGTTHDLGTPAQARENFAFRRDYLGPVR